MEKYFQVLGLSVNASAIEIKKAYRKLAKEWHPDRYQGDLIQQEKATEKFRQINEAYQIISEYIQNNNIAFDSPNISKTGIKVEKASPNFYYYLGVEKAEAGEDQEAIDLFTQAIRCDDNYLKAYQYRGFLLEKMGFMQRAQADFKRVKEIKIGNPFNTQSSNSSKTEDFSSTTANEARVESTPSKKATSQAKSPKNKAESAKNKSESWQSKFIGNADIVTAIAINSSGKLIAAGYDSNRMYLWDQQQKKHMVSYQGHTKAIRSIIFSIDQQRIYSAGNDHQIRIHSLNTSKPTLLGQAKHQHCQAVTALALSHDGEILVSGSADKTLKIWFLTKRIEPLTLTGFASDITGLAISPDNQFMAIASLDKNIRLRGLNDGKLLKSIPVNSSTSSLTISADGKLLAIGGFNHEITVWDLETGEKVNTLLDHCELISGLHFLPNSKELISVSWDGSVKLWRLDDHSVKTIGSHQDAIWSSALSLDGKILVTGSRDKRIGIWTKV